MDIIANIHDQNLMGRAFPEDKSSYSVFFAMLKTIFALPKTEEDLSVISQCTGGRKTLPEKQVREAYIIAGRRGTKSWGAACMAVHQAMMVDFTPYLAPGELATILIVAVDKAQAMIIFRYIQSIIDAVPMFKSKVVRERAMDLELSNRVQIIIRTSSYASVRGYTLAMVILEEVSFWRVEGVNPDHEILLALRPGLSTIPNSMLVAVSSPYGRAGILYDAFKKYYGEERDDIVVWKAPTRVMNPTLSQEFIDREFEKDPIAAASEYGADFRADIETCYPLEWLELAIVPNRFELPPLPGMNYRAFTDPSGGAADAFCLAIGHRESDGRLIHDVLRSTLPPFNPQETVKKYANLLNLYRIKEVVGDRYAGIWVSEAFQAEGIKYVHSKETKSDLYQAFTPLLAQGVCELLDDKVLMAQLRSLERRKRGGGREYIDAPPRQHDDSANAVAGLMVNLSFTYPNLITFDWLEGAKRRVITQAAH